MKMYRQYASLRPRYFDNRELMQFAVSRCIDFEVFMDDIVPRQLVLFSNDSEKKALVHKLSSMNVKRLHCSYWAYPTSFLTKNNFSELVERFGSLDAVIDYYGDATGQHLFNRWVQEYELACELDAQSYTFHLIDYAPVDGKWPFTVSRDEVLQAMIFMTQQLICLLIDRKLLTPHSPLIDLENAGWGLEFGVQTASDYRKLFSQIYDPYCKLAIGWDLNHLLHAVGNDDNTRFMLAPEEITVEMNVISKKPETVVQNWLELNLLESSLISRIGSIHLSDCAMKRVEYFRNGQLVEPYYSELMSLDYPDAQEEYGVGIVLSEYDSHLPLGYGVLGPDAIRDMIHKILLKSPKLVILHELKNSQNPQTELSQQIAYLS